MIMTLREQIDRALEAQREIAIEKEKEAAKRNAQKTQSDAEVIVTDPITGGQKGRKPEEYALIPTRPLAEVARVYGFGAAEKYDPFNWTKGYSWNLSISALMRHIEAWRGGEHFPKDSPHHHLAHAAFHLFTLMEFERLGLGTDDRWIK